MDNAAFSLRSLLEAGAHRPRTNVRLGSLVAHSLTAMETGNFSLHDTFSQDMSCDRLAIQAW